MKEKMEKPLITLLRLVLFQSHSTLNSLLVFFIFIILFYSLTNSVKGSSHCLQETREKTKAHSFHYSTSVTSIMRNSELEYKFWISRSQVPFFGDH